MRILWSRVTIRIAYFLKLVFGFLDLASVCFEFGSNQGGRNWSNCDF